MSGPAPEDNEPIDLVEAPEDLPSGSVADEDKPPETIQPEDVADAEASNANDDGDEAMDTAEAGVTDAAEAAAPAIANAVTSQPAATSDYDLLSTGPRPTAAHSSSPSAHPQETVLFERAAYRSPLLRTGALGLDAGAPGVPGAGGEVGGASLFDRYASEGSSRRGWTANGNSETLTSRLRSTGKKIACYLNTECNRGRSTIIHLPEACDTLGEVFPLIQRRMRLDERMLYAAELFLPDGVKITNYKMLSEAAAIDTAVIVGCGEPFDASTIPQSMLAFHRHGGGRDAAKTVKKELAEKKLRASQLKADQVRASGHGLSNAAASAAKLAAIETNRESAANMRHDYMNQLIARSAQQTELIRHVQSNNARLRADRARREAAKKSVWSQERLQDLEEHRRKDANAWREKQEHEESIAARRLDHARNVRMSQQNGGKLARAQLQDQRKAAGLERRMSYISRSVEKAAREQDLSRAHQQAKQHRAAQNAMRMGLSSALTSQIASDVPAGELRRLM